MFGLVGCLKYSEICREELWATFPSVLLFQQGWNITVDLVIGPKGIRQLTSQDAKVERDGVSGAGGGSVPTQPQAEPSSLSAASYPSLPHLFFLPHC